MRLVWRSWWKHELRNNFQQIWKNKASKRLIHLSPTILYDSESWVMQEKNLSRIVAVEMKFVWRITANMGTEYNIRGYKLNGMSRLGEWEKTGKWMDKRPKNRRAWGRSRTIWMISNFWSEKGKILIRNRDLSKWQEAFLPWKAQIRGRERKNHFFSCT